MSFALPLPMGETPTTFSIYDLNIGACRFIYVSHHSLTIASEINVALRSLLPDFNQLVILLNTPDSGISVCEPAATD